MRFYKLIKVILPAFLIIFSISCARSGLDDGIVTKYQCENGFEFTANVHQGKDQTIRDLSGNLLILDIVPSASGLKYSDGVNTFWTKGDSAMLELSENMSYKECTAVK